MNLHDLGPAKGSRPKKKRVGRGPGSGLGKTAGRGHKGQKSRSGHSHTPGFEGGQMPLVRRIPKRGFKNKFRTEFAVVNLAQLADLAVAIDPVVLAEKGLVRAGMPVKVLGDGDLSMPINVTAHRFSKSARAKIEKAGGSCQELAQ
jgi:large subunit ribosomal protein L15